MQDYKNANTMYNNSKIMKRAWVLFGEVYNYPAIPFQRIGRLCFAPFVKNAWIEARREANNAAIPQETKSASLHGQIEQHKYMSFRYDIGAMTRTLQTHIETLEAAIFFLIWVAIHLIKQIYQALNCILNYGAVCLCDIIHLRDLEPSLGKSSFYYNGAVYDDCELDEADFEPNGDDEYNNQSEPHAQWEIDGQTWIGRKI